MNNPKLAQAVKLALLSAGAVSVASPAVAQEEPVKIEEITVTGSRLIRSDLESVSPLSVVDGEEFEISGNLNVEQKLAELPLTLPSFGPSSNNPGDGTARVDLRGLGTSRTLVLVNGRRWISATQSGVVDLNTIPGSLIKKVDVITGGASAVYGSDAIAGVVNFQMKTDFEGVQVTGLYDVTAEGDAEKYNTDITMGGNFDGGRGNAVLYVGYSKREPLYQGDRDFSRFALGDAAPAGTPGQDGSTGVGGPLAASGSSGVPGTRVFGGPTIDPDGVAGSGDEFSLGTFDSSGGALPWIEPDSRFNYAPDNFLQLPQERFAVSAFLHYDLSERATVYSEITSISNKSPQELAPTPAFLGSVEVNPDSVFFAPEVQTALDGVRSDTDGDGDIDGDDNAFLPFIGRRMVENGPRQAKNTRNGLRLLTGVRGDISDDWQYDVNYQFARTDYSELLNNDVSDTRFRQAVLTNDAGTACQDPSGGCVPMNIFGPGNISAAAVDFVNVGATNVTDIDRHIYTASVTGTLGSIGDAEPMSVAFGVEHREEDSTFRPDTFLSSGDVLGFNAGEATAGGFDVNDVFAEFRAPLLTGKTGAESLDIWLAARSSDYSNIGNVTAYAAALNWAPIETVRARIGYQEAVRAPNVAELFQGSSNGFPGAEDPCSDAQASHTPAQVALCEATGVPTGLVGNFTQANTQIEGIFGGNPNLREETSDTFTAGLVIQPMDGLDITVDYFDIAVEDAISILGGSLDGTLNICYNIRVDINSEECQAVTRRPDGNVATVEVLNANIGELETSGFDVNVNYATEFDQGLFGQGSFLSVTFRSTFLQTFDITPVSALPRVVDCAGQFNGEGECNDPRPEMQFNTRVTWNTGPLGLSMLWRHMSEVDDERIKNDDTVDGSNLSVPSLDAINYVDLTGTYDFTDAFRLNVGIKNVFDAEPTFIGDAQEQANTFPETYDVFGPRYFMSFSYKFL